MSPVPAPTPTSRGMALTARMSSTPGRHFGSQNIFSAQSGFAGMVSYVPVNVPGIRPRAHRRHQRPDRFCEPCSHCKLTRPLHRLPRSAQSRRQQLNQSAPPQARSHTMTELVRRYVSADATGPTASFRVPAAAEDPRPLERCLPERFSNSPKQNVIRHCRIAEVRSLPPT